MPKPTFFASQQEWRAWLAAHHDTETECLVGFVKVTTGKANMSWSESVDQALCFGWIDAVRRGIDADHYSIRFTRRKPGSNWSAINVKKVEALRGAGLMTEAGEAAYQLRSDAKTAIYSYEKEAAEFTPEQLLAMQADPDGWAFWEQQPPGYRKQATHWVTGAKRDETKAKRLAQLAADCAAACGCDDIDVTRDVVLLGSTGSVGTQAIDVALANPEKFRVVGLAAGGDRPDLLAKQALDLGVGVVGVAEESAVAAVKDALGTAAVTVIGGAAAAEQVAAWPCDLVINGMTGSVGLAPTLAALEAGRLLALANKESLIAGGPLVAALAKPGQIIPVDSEHSAIAQCLRSGTTSEVRRLVLTASGGPFRGKQRADLTDVTVEQAMAHPTWDMGPVITINSATLINKGLELIEAHWLFDIGYDAIDVVVHPQSIIHSMVEFVDGSTIAQASPPDMHLPIALAMAWPDRVDGAAPAVDWSQAATWTFEPLDEVAFPAVELAKQAGKTGGTSTAVLNAANEEAVAAFIAGQIGFTSIVDTVAGVLDSHETLMNVTTLAEVREVEDWARRMVHERVQKGTSR